MNNLKVFDVDRMADVRSLSDRFYRKSDADEVIAVKDTEIEELKSNYDEVSGRLQTTNLIKDEQTVCSRIAQNVGHLVHFHHKGTLTAGKIITRTDTRKNAVHKSDLCLGSRNKASDLRHENDQRSLTHIG